MFFFQAEDGIRDLVRSRGLGDVYKRQQHAHGQNVQEGRVVGDHDGGALKGFPLGVQHLLPHERIAVEHRLFECRDAAVEPSHFHLLADRDDRQQEACLLYTSPSPRDRTRSRMPSSA